VPLTLSIVALALGPLLAYVARRIASTAAFLDGLVLVAISGLVFLHVVPHAMLTVGWIAVVAMIAGFGIPILLERTKRFRSHASFIPLIAVGLAVHAFADGAALTTHDDGQSGILALAIVFHRLPDGLAIWSVVEPRRGARTAVIALSLLACATVIGFVVGGAALLSVSTEHALAIVQAFVAGSVLHVILHSPTSHEHASHHDHDDDDHKHTHEHGAPAFAAGVGAIVGLAVVVLVTTSHPIIRRETNELEAGATFLALALDAAPAVLVAIVGAGFVHAWIPDALFARVGGRGGAQQAAMGALLAPLVPTCSCGVVPFYRTLIRRGASVATAIALLVSAPELALPALMISWALLGRSLTCARVVAALLTAICAGVLVARITPQHRHDRVSHHDRESKLARFYEGVTDVLEHTGPWLIVGLVVAALVEPMARADLFSGLSAAEQVPLFVLLSLPFYVCASGATPLVAILIHKGLAPGAALAFLVAGPASNLATFGVLSRLHGRYVAVVYTATVLTLATACGFIANVCVTSPPHAALHDFERRGPSTLDVASLVIVAIAVGVVLVRRGPRHLLRELLHFAPSGADS